MILGCETIDKPTLRTYTCTNCARTIDVDGYGYAVLRKGLWKSPAFEASVLPGVPGARCLLQAHKRTASHAALPMAAV